MSENSLKVAFASSDERQIDEHFGSCTKLTIYELLPHSYEHIKTVNFAAIKGHNQQKISHRLIALQTCFAVYCLACGNPVRQQLLAQGIRVIITPEQALISTLISKIQKNWPGKVAERQQSLIKKQQDKTYFEAITESEWE